MISSVKKPSQKSTKNASKYRTVNGILPPINQREPSKINVQGREKLGATLIQKIAKKLGTSPDSQIIRGEVAKFLQQEIINEQKLKMLEKQIKMKLSNQANRKELKQSLNQNLKAKSTSNQNSVTAEVSPDQAQGSSPLKTTN